MKLRTALTVLTACAAGLGCASGGRPARVEETNLAYLDDDAVRYQAAPAPRKRTPVVSGQIARADLDAVLLAGPQPVLASYEVKPKFAAPGQFAGWEIQTVADTPYAVADLRAGDVVTAVNGKPVERPEHVFAVWDELGRASELVVSYQRGGLQRELRFRIQGASKPVPESTRSGVKSGP